MVLHPLVKVQLGFDWKCLWAKAVVSLYLKKEFEKKSQQVFSYRGAVAQQVFSLCLQVVTELGLTCQAGAARVPGVLLALLQQPGVDVRVVPVWA